VISFVIPVDLQSRRADQFARKVRWMVWALAIASWLLGAGPVHGAGFLRRCSWAGVIGLQAAIAYRPGALAVGLFLGERRMGTRF